MKDHEHRRTSLLRKMITRISQYSADTNSKGKHRKKKKKMEFPQETNPTRNHEVLGSIPGLRHWVKDMVLL